MSPRRARLVNSYPLYREDDFDSALGQFGVNALLFRTLQLCAGYPNELRSQLRDFRTSLQWREIDSVRERAGKIERRAAHTIYVLCTLKV